MPRLVNVLAKGLVLFLALGASACSLPCGAAYLCALDENKAVCDGSGYLACDDANRGKRIGCVHDSKVAVCTPQGWTFENSGKP